jgi:hypothetical protein
LLVARAVDNAHASGTDLLQNPVVRQGLVEHAPLAERAKDSSFVDEDKP